jgi:type II secretory pathway pseudopilin PulG
LTRNEAGYALTEVLVAAAIAGAVLAAGMTALSGGAASLRTAGAAAEAGLAARNIEARLSAGLPPRLAIEGYEGWSARLVPLDLPADPVTGAVLSRAEITGPDGWRSSLVVVEDGPGRRP